MGQLGYGYGYGYFGSAGGTVTVTVIWVSWEVRLRLFLRAKRAKKNGGTVMVIRRKEVQLRLFSSHPGGTVTVIICEKGTVTVILRAKRAKKMGTVTC